MGMAVRAAARVVVVVEEVMGEEVMDTATREAAKVVRVGEEVVMEMV
jgi:hypothetical protein